MLSETFLYIIFIGFLAFFTALFQYLYKSEKSKLNILLAFFRFLTYFSILVLLLNPSIKKNKIEIVKPNLLVAVDNSTSIKYNSQNTDVKNLVKLLKNDTELNTKFEINYYAFGSNLYALDSLIFSENQTNLSIPFQEFTKLYKSDNNPTLIISDGNQTVGNSPEFTSYKSPVFPFIVGDTTVFEDIAITQLNVNKYTYINNKLPIELFVNYTGTKPVSKNLTIFNNGKKIYSKQLEFSKSQNSKMEFFFLTAESKGTQFYSVSIEALENEQNTVNNTKDFSINVIDEKAEILILTSILHPDLGMLKKSVESNKQRSVIIATISDFKGNISNFQMVILYQPTAKFETIFKEIKKKKLNYFIVSGLATDWKFLNSVQGEFLKKSIVETENYYPVFNSNYTSFLNSDIGFSDFGPLEDRFGEIEFSVPYNSLLFQKIGTFSTEKPLLVTFEKENQRGAVLFGENSWRWRMNSFSSNKTFELFDGFMSNLIQYLTSNNSNKRLNVVVDPIFYANETIKILASYLDENLNFDSRAKLWLTISNKETNYVKRIPFAFLDNRFVIELSGIPSGEYLYTVTVENQQENVSGSFKIIPFEVEQQFTNSNDKELGMLALKSNGKLFYNNQETYLIEALKSDKRFKSIQTSTIIKTPLIDWKWILGFIIFSLSLEWFIRKYYGKI